MNAKFLFDDNQLKMNAKISFDDNDKSINKLGLQGKAAVGSGDRPAAMNKERRRGGADQSQDGTGKCSNVPVWDSSHNGFSDRSDSRFRRREWGGRAGS